MNIANSSPVAKLIKCRICIGDGGFYRDKVLWQHGSSIENRRIIASANGDVNRNVDHDAAESSDSEWV